MSAFTVKVVERPEIKCVGIKISTSMDRTSTDCPALWMSFGPRMDSVPANSDFPDQSFGASIMTSETTFDYWAVMPLASGAEIPEGMATLVLPAGEYAECELESLKEMGDGLTYVYTEWPKTQDQYAMDTTGICYEKYQSDFMKTGRLVIYSPVVRK